MIQFERKALQVLWTAAKNRIGTAKAPGGIHHGGTEITEKRIGALARTKLLRDLRVSVVRLAKCGATG